MKVGEVRTVGRSQGLFSMHREKNVRMNTLIQKYVFGIPGMVCVFFSYLSLIVNNSPLDPSSDIYILKSLSLHAERVVYSVYVTTESERVV